MIAIENDNRFRVVRETLTIDGLNNTYRFMQLSDSHMSPDSPLDSDEDRQKAAKLREIWMGHGNGLTQEENFLSLTAYGRQQEVDLFVYAGDMTDFPSVGTAAEAKTMYDAAGPYFYAPGNHEQAFRFPAFFEAATNGDPAFQVMELGELRLVAVDNAAHSVPDRVMDRLKAVLYGDKPVILLHHTPIDCDTLHPDAERYWEDLTYFLFGLPGAGENVDEYIRLLTKETTQLKAILAGHLHYDHVDTFENGVTQYISAPCLAGFGRILDIRG